MLLPALALFIAGQSARCGFAQTSPQLIAARAVQGLGGAGLMAMAQAAIADVVSPRERGRYQGYMAVDVGHLLDRRADRRRLDDRQPLLALDVLGRTCRSGCRRDAAVRAGRCGCSARAADGRGSTTRRRRCSSAA